MCDESNTQKEDSFHKKIELPVNEETSKVIHFGL